MRTVEIADDLFNLLVMLGLLGVIVVAVAGALQ